MSEPVGNGPRSVVPSNSHKEREAKEQTAEPREQVTKIVEGKVVTRKQPWYRRVARNMIADDAQTIGDYILIDVFIPAIKNLIFDIVTQGTSRALYQGGRAGLRNSTIRGGGGGGFGLRGTVGGIREKYQDYSSSNSGRVISHEARARHDFDEIILTSREEAINVVENLMAHLERYGSVSVKDLYDFCGVTNADYAAQSWGWTDLINADVRQYRGGWLLDLPAPIALRR